MTSGNGSHVSVSPNCFWNVKEMTSHQVSVAAEAYTASLFAQCGFNVSVQYGANQPEYDLLVERQPEVAKISVKGSKVGGWALAVSHKTKLKGETENVGYHEAIDRWYEDQQKDLIYVFVEYHGVTVGCAPRVYLATPEEIRNHMKTQRNGMGHLALAEDHLKYHPKGKRDDKIPAQWKFSVERVEELIGAQSITEPVRT